MPRGCKHVPGSTVDLPVTPMLDMTLQLLFFFLVTFQPASAEGKVDLAIHGGTGEGPVAPPTLPPPLHIPVGSSFHLQVQTNQAGAIVRIVVEHPPGRQVCRDVIELAAYLQQIRDGATSRPSEVVIHAEGNLKYACLIGVVDACNRAGFKGVGFGPPR
jgi:biopolymer transport protein ExbD